MKLLRTIMITRRHFGSAIAATGFLGLSSVRAKAKSLTYVGWSQDEAASKPTLTAMFDSYRKANADP